MADQTISFPDGTTVSVFAPGVPIGFAAAPQRTAMATATAAAAVVGPQDVLPHNVARHVGWTRHADPYDASADRCAVAHVVDAGVTGRSGNQSRSGFVVSAARLRDGRIP